MMNATDELRGTMVLIHPELTNDPAGMPNQIGVITGVEPENDNVYVGFGKRGQGLYGMDAVLLLKNAPAIYSQLVEHHQEINLATHKALYTIALLQDQTASPANAVAALELVKNSAEVRKYATKSMEQALGLEKRPSMYVER